MSPLDTLIAELVGREGRYANNPNDSGGETMWGITEQVARAYGYNGPMKEMERSIAAGIYKARYWYGPKFDQVWLQNPAIAEELLDTGVNMGTGIAGTFLQRALNVLNRRASAYPDLTVDGNVGPMTLSALKSFLAWRGTSNGQKVLLRLLNSQQGVRYMDIAENAPKNEEFTYGWVLNRVS